MTLPILAGLFIVSDSLIQIIGPEWVTASPVIKILCIWGMLIIFAYFTGPFLQALSRSHVTAILEWARTIAGIVILLIVSVLVKDKGVNWQVMGVAVARLATGAFLIMPIFLYILMRLSKISFYDIISSITPSILAATATIGSVLLLKKSNLLIGLILPVSLATQVVIGAVAGIFMLLFLDKQLRTYAVSMLKIFTNQCR